MKQRNNSAWVICLGAGTSQLPLIKEARSLGYSVLAVDKNPDSKGFRFATETLVHSIYDSDSLISKLKSRSFDGLLCRCTGEALFTAAKINKAFGLPGIDQSLAEISTSKSALRENCSVWQLQMPHGIKSDVDTVISFAKEFERHVVVKPDFTVVGKQSIKKIGLEKVGTLKQSIESAAASSGNGLVEVEQFVEGYDCSVLFWMSDGKLTPIFSWDELTFFDENGDLISVGVAAPSMTTSGEVMENIVRSSSRLAANFSAVSAPIAFSFRVDLAGNIWLLEIHCDFTGDLILDVLAPESTGINYLKLLTSAAIEGLLADETKKLFSTQNSTPTAVIYDRANAYKLVKANSIGALRVEIEKATRQIAQRPRYAAGLQ